MEEESSHEKQIFSMLDEKFFGKGYQFLHSSEGE